MTSKLGHEVLDCDPEEAETGMSRYFIHGYKQRVTKLMGVKIRWDHVRWSIYGTQQKAGHQGNSTGGNSNMRKPCHVASHVDVIFVLKSH